MNKQCKASGEQRIEGFEGRRHGCAAGRGQSVEAYGEVVRDALVRRKRMPQRIIFIRDNVGFPFLVSCRFAVAGSMGREANHNFIQ